MNRPITNAIIFTKINKVGVQRNDWVFGLIPHAFRSFSIYLKTFFSPCVAANRPYDMAFTWLIVFSANNSNEDIHSSPFF